MSFEQSKTSSATLPAGPHVSPNKLRDFIQGKTELANDEQMHIVVCAKCSHQMADWVLTGNKSNGSVS
jgi:hypothetical protein